MCRTKAVHKGPKYLSEPMMGQVFISFATKPGKPATARVGEMSKFTKDIIEFHTKTNNLYLPRDIIMWNARKYDFKNTCERNFLFNPSQAQNV